MDVYAANRDFRLRRFHLVPSAAGLDLKESLSAKRTGVIFLNRGRTYLRPLSDASEAETVRTAIDVCLKWWERYGGGTFDADGALGFLERGGLVALH